MIKRVTQLGGLSASLLALAATASADIKVNENISVSGYVVGLVDYSDVDGSDSASTLDLQATKFVTKANFAPVSGMLSYYAGADNDPLVLDAFFTYDLGNGASITGGKFLSWLGYEAFDPVNMMTITYAWQSGAYGMFGIPAYHSGVKFETTSDTFNAGFAVLDSNRYDTGLKGDGRLDDGFGLEAYGTIKSGSLTIFGGIAYDNYDDDVGMVNSKLDSYSADVWAQYVAGAVTFAGEFCWYTQESETMTIGLPSSRVADDYDSYFWGLWAKFAASEKTAYVGRVAGGAEDYSGAAALDRQYLKFTFSPIFTITGNLEVVGEVSHTMFDKFGTGSTAVDNATYFGVQGRFKF